METTGLDLVYLYRVSFFYVHRDRLVGCTNKWHNKLTLDTNEHIQWINDLLLFYSDHLLTVQLFDYLTDWLIQVQHYG